MIKFRAAFYNTGNKQCGNLYNNFIKFINKTVDKSLEKMVQVLSPDTIVVYSYAPDKIFAPYIKAGINIVPFDNYVDMVRKAAN